MSSSYMSKNTQNLTDTNPCPRCQQDGLTFCRCGGPGGGGGSGDKENTGSKKYETSHQTTDFGRYKNTNSREGIPSAKLTLGETKKSEDASEKIEPSQKTTSFEPLSLTPPVQKTTHQKEEEETVQSPFSPTPFSTRLDLIKK